MTIPVGISSFFLLPDTPHTTRAWYLTKKERQLATERVLRAGKAKPVKVTIATFKKILSSWKWYAFVMGYVVSQPRICSRMFKCARNLIRMESFMASLVVPALTLGFGSSLKGSQWLIAILYRLGPLLSLERVLLFGASFLIIPGADSSG